MTTDETDLFRAAVPDVPPYDSEARAAVRDRLLAEARPVRRPRLVRYGLRAALAGGVAAALAGTVLFARTDEARPLPPVTMAAAALDRAARVAEANPDPVPRGDQYVYSEVLQRSGPVGGPWKTYRNRAWASADGTRIGLYYEHGRKLSQGTPGARVPPRKPNGPVRDATAYADLAGLPRDPDRLIAHLRNDPHHGGRPDDVVVEKLREVLSSPLLPPGIRPTAFRALAKLPGTTVVPDAVDARGRHGIGLVLMRPSEFGPAENVLILDPRTYRFLGRKNTYVEDVGRDGVERGEKIVDWTALVRTAIVDEPGHRS